MMSKDTVTKYGVADGDRIIGDLFDDLDTAFRHEAWVRDMKARLGEESAARVVTVEATTTYSRPRAYKEPAESETIEPSTEPTE